MAGQILSLEKSDTEKERNHLEKQRFFSVMRYNDTV